MQSVKIMKSHFPSTRVKSNYQIMVALALPASLATLSESKIALWVIGYDLDDLAGSTWTAWTLKSCGFA